MKSPSPPGLLLHRFTAVEILGTNPSSLLELVGRHQLRDPVFLNEYHDRLLFDFEGYEPDQFVHADLRIRSFCRALHRRWPSWLWFGTLRTFRLADMVYACLPNLVTTQRDGVPHLEVAFHYDEFQRLLRPQCQALQTLGRCAGWSEHRIATRIQEVGDYLGLPPAPNDSKGRET